MTDTLPALPADIELHRRRVRLAAAELRLKHAREVIEQCDADTAALREANEDEARIVTSEESRATWAGAIPDAEQRVAQLRAELAAEEQRLAAG
jgi:hypothetical protein